jgi:outer membrane protein TolC
MYWQSPALHDCTRVLKSSDAPLIDPDKRYRLPELIDLAQRLNPETPMAWEAARRGALAVGLVESEYFPVLAIPALGGYQSLGVAGSNPAPQP